MIIYQIGSFPDLWLVRLWNITAECPDQCPCAPKGGTLSFAFYMGSDPALTSNKKIIIKIKKKLKNKEKKKEKKRKEKKAKRMWHTPKLLANIIISPKIPGL